MEREQIEFLISQYVDGTLPASESAALESLLARDAEARELVAEYRQLDAALKASPVPAVRWDRFAEHLSQKIADEPEPVNSYKITFVQRTVRFAIAATILLVSGLVIRSYLIDETPPADVMALNETIEVTGPVAEAPAGQSVVQIAIGPSPEIAADPVTWRYAEGVVYRPARVVIAAVETNIDRDKAPH